MPPLGLALAIGPALGRRASTGSTSPARRPYVLCAFGTTIGFHRYFTHRSFEARAPVKATLAILGCMTMQGPVTQWVTDHRKHHALSDKEGDPHSPHAGHGDGAWGALARLRARARRLDVLEPGHGAGPRVRQDLYEDRLIRTIDRLYLLWVVAHARDPVRDRLRLGGTGSSASRRSSGAA